MKKIIYLLIVSFFTVQSYGQSIQPSGPLSFCAGDNVVLTVTPTTGITAYQWKKNNAAIAGATVSSYTATTSGNYTVILNGGGTAKDTLGPVAVTVNPLPAVAVNQAGICTGKSATLTATGANTYNWSPATGLSATSGSIVTANPSSTTIYTVTGTNTATGCKNTATATVTVNPYPVAGFTFAPNSQCSNVPVSFTNTSSGGANYSWNFGDINSGGNNSSTTANPVHTFIGNAGNATQTFTVTQTVTSAAGCADSAKVVVTTTQIADGTLGGTGMVTYNGQTYFTTCGFATGDFTFTNQTLTGGTNSSYQIVWGDGSTDFTASSFASTTHTYGIGSHPILLIIKGNNGCIDTTRYFSFVGTNPAVGLNNPGNTLACTGESLTFPITGVSTNVPGTVYTVTFNDGTPPITYIHPDIPASITHTFTTTSCGTTSSNGTTPYNNSFSANIVAANPCNTSAATVVPIYISKKPKAAFLIAPDDSVCINDTVTLTNTSQSNFVNSGICLNGNSIWTITPATGWTINNGGKLGNDFGLTDPSVWQNGDSILSLNFTVPGVYTIKIKTGNNKCGTDETAQTICVTIPPVPSFTLDNSTGCIPFNVTATNTTTALNSCKSPTYFWSVSYTQAFCGTSSSWDFAPGFSATSPNPAFVFNNAGNYTIQMTVTNECGSYTSSKTVNVKKPPAVSITIPPYPCGPVTITPVAKDTSCGTIAPTYLWTFDGGTPASSTAKNPGPVAFSATGTHAITLAETNECGTTTASSSVTVTTAPDVIVPADQVYCGGVNTAPLNFSSTVGTPAYQWTNSNPSIGLPASGTGTIPSFIPVNNGAVPVTATISVTPFVSEACSGIPLSFKITVNPMPAPPAVLSPITYCLNVTAPALTATAAAGNTLTWYNNPLLTGGSATAPAPVTSLAATTSYYVTQTNSFSCASDASAITVNVNPSISGNIIASNQNICANTTPSALSTVNAVSAGSGSFNYTWQSSSDAGVTWTNIAGANNETYSPPALTATIQYRRVINSATCSDTSWVVIITVQGALDNYGITASQTICEATQPLLLTGQLPTGGGGSYSYVWESSTDNVNWNPTGNISPDYQPPALIQSTYYRRRVIASQCSAVSGAILITVKPTPLGTITAPVTNICTTDIGNISFTATIGTAPFTVELLITRPGKPDTTITQVVNSNGPASINVIGANSAPGRYIITLTKITDANICLNNTGNISKDTIDVINPIVNVIQKDSIICAGESVLIQNQVLTGGNSVSQDALYTYQWESSPAGQINWQVVTGANEATLTVTPSASTCYRRKVKTNNLCESISNTICITVNANIGNNIIRASQQLCVNTTPANLTGGVATGGDNTYIYQWQTSADSVNWTAVATSPDYQPAAYSLAGNYYFRRNVSSGGCTAASNVITITVKPDTKAAFTATATTICNSVDLSNFINTTTFPEGNGLYQWYADGALFGNNTTGVFPGYTIPKPDDTVVIKLVTTSQYGCKPDSIQQPFITVITAIAQFSKDTSFGCGPLPVNFTNTSSILSSNIQYSWDFGNGITSQLQQPGTVTFNSNPFFNDTTYQISLKAFNGCDTTVWRDSVKVRANPKARFGVDTTIGCSPFTVQFTNTSPGGPNTYYWDFGNGAKDTTFANGTFKYTYNIGNVVDTITVRLIAENQCGRDTQSIDLRVAPNIIRPLININSSQLSGCVPHNISVENNTSGATGFTWNFGDNTAPVVTNNNQSIVLHTYNSAGVFTIQVDITNGCSDTTVFRKVTVFAKPVAAFTTNAAGYCAGDTVKVANNSQNATNYQWFWGDGTTSADSLPVHVFNISGNYNILLRAEKTINSGLVCMDTLVRPITVLAKPVVTVQSNIKAINCAPFTLNVSAPGIISEAVSWYFYDSTVNPSIIISTGISSQYIFNKPGTFYVKMVAVNAQGCTDSTTISFTIRGKAVASFTPFNLAFCTRDTTISYKNTSTYDGTDPISYRWLVDNAFVSNSANFTHRYNVLPAVILPKIFTASLVVTNTVGCSDTATATLQLSPLAKGQFSITNTNACVPFKPAIVNGSTFTTKYQWLLNGTLVSTSAIPDMVVSKASTNYTVTLIADNIYGCKPDTLSVTFTTRPRPVASFVLSDTLGCSGTLSVATTNLTTGASSYTWTWSDGSASSGFASPTHLYTRQGQFLIVLIASDGVCRDTAQQLVKVSVKPTVDFRASQTITCDTARVKFTNITTNGSNYLWSFGDGTFSNETNPSHTFLPSPAPYTVTLVANGTYGCKDSAVKANLILAKVPPVADFFISPTPVITVPHYTFSYNNLSLNSAKYTYLWSLGDGSFASTRDVPDKKYADTGNYRIRLIVLDTSTNCADTAIKIARIDGYPGYLYVPNAICPACIQSNVRSFLPKGAGLKSYRLQVYTIWNELVFETTALDSKGSPTVAWNGTWQTKPKKTAVQQDAYIWRIDAVFLNGSEWLGMIYPGESKYKKVGTITVIR